MSARKRPSRRTDATGRSTREAKHARLYLWVARTPAYRSLSLGARCLYAEMQLLFSGTNNGDIGLSWRQAAELLGVHKETVGGYFAELEDRGFIRPRQRGTFSYERAKPRAATTWVLTEYGCDGQLPTKDFTQWQPPAADAARKKSRDGKSVPARTENPSRPRPESSGTPLYGTENPSQRRPKRPPAGTENPPTTSLPATASGRAPALALVDPEGVGGAESAASLVNQRVAVADGAHAAVEKSGKSLRQNSKRPAPAVDERADIRRRMVQQVTTLGYGSGIVWTQLLAHPNDLDALTDDFAAGALSAAEVAERIGLRRVNGHAHAAPPDWMRS